MKEGEKKLHKYEVLLRDIQNKIAIEDEEDIRTFSNLPNLSTPYEISEINRRKLIKKTTTQLQSKQSLETDFSIFPCQKITPILDLMLLEDGNRSETESRLCKCGYKHWLFGKEVGVIIHSSIFGSVFPIGVSVGDNPHDLAVEFFSHFGLEDRKLIEELSNRISHTFRKKSHLLSSKSNNINNDDLYSDNHNNHRVNNNQNNNQNNNNNNSKKNVVNNTSKNIMMTNAKNTPPDNSKNTSNNTAKDNNTNKDQKLNNHPPHNDNYPIGSNLSNNLSEKTAKNTENNISNDNSNNNNGNSNNSIQSSLDEIRKLRKNQHQLHLQRETENESENKSQNSLRHSPMPDKHPYQSINQNNNLINHQTRGAFDDRQNELLNELSPLDREILGLLMKNSRLQSVEITLKMKSAADYSFSMLRSESIARLYSQAQSKSNCKTISLRLVQPEEMEIKNDHFHLPLSDLFPHHKKLSFEVGILRSLQ